jgi:hypothetical protein
MGRLDDRVALISKGAAGEIAVATVVPVAISNSARARSGAHSCR